MPDTGSLKDFVGDLVHHPVDLATGMIGAAVDRAKAAYSSNPVASGNKQETYEGVGGAARKATIDKAVADSGG